MSMKVYVFAPGTRYSFGSTIIAAHSVEEAELFNRDARLPGEFIEELEGVTATGEPRIVHDCSGEE
jgi:hypothetical protein